MVFELPKSPVASRPPLTGARLGRARRRQYIILAFLLGTLSCGAVAWADSPATPVASPSTTTTASSPAVTARPAAVSTPIDLETANPDTSGIDWTRQISIIGFFLAITCVLIWICVKFLYNKNGPLTLGRSNNKQLRVLERCMLMPQKGIFLVQVGSKTLLVGATDHQISTLAELDPATLQTPAADATAADSSPFQFQQVLANLVATRRNDG